jgi:hypothetical protein
MKRNLFIVGVLALVAMLVWSASRVPALSPPAPTPAATLGPPTPCEACAQATLGAALTQEKVNLSAQEAQATATADILRSQALATSNAAAATQGVALTQAKVSANALQAQAAATADILRAHTLATSNAAAATQSAAQTEDRLNANALQAQVAATADMVQANTVATSNAAAAARSAAQTEAVLQQLTSGAATQNASVTAAQQRMDQVVSGTATALAVAALQTQSSVTQRPEPGTSLWTWVAPILIAVAAVSSLWGISRWLARRQNGGRSEMSAPLSNPPLAILPPLPPISMNDLPPVIVNQLPPPGPWPTPGGEVIPGRDQLADTDNRQVHEWLADVKDKLLSERKE